MLVISEDSCNTSRLLCVVSFRQKLQTFSLANRKAFPSQKSLRRQESSKENWQGSCASLPPGIVSVKVYMYGILTTFNLIYRWHDFSPVRHEVFANSRLSLSLGSGAPLANIFLMGTNFFYVFVNKIHACLTDPDYGPSL